MRIGIDGLALSSHTGGDETYLRNIVRALTAIEPDNSYTLFLNQRLPDDYIPGAEHINQVVMRPPIAQLRVPVSLPIAALQAHVDLLHVQYMAPWYYPHPIVVSVHDIAYERYPYYFPPSLLMQLRAVVPLTIRRAATVLTLSEFSKRDIMRRYSVPSEKIVVTPCAADPMFRVVHDPVRLTAVRERYATGADFILAVGNLQPRKNLKTLIEAYVRLRRADALRCKLVIVGRRGWLSDGTFVAARNSGYSDELVFTEYVPDDDLVALYNAADLFVYPSVFEGFGLPPLEAMASGTPVITGNASALPEVVGDAALTVDPLSAEAMATAITTILGDSKLKAELVARGLHRATAFSWEKTAHIILDVYRRAVHH